MSVITGRGGDVTVNIPDAGVFVQLPDVTKWSWSAEINVVEYASNMTAGHKVRIAGASSAGGSIEGVYDNTRPITEKIYEGKECSMRMTFSPLHHIHADVIFDNFEIEDEIEDGEVVRWKADYSTRGQWVYPAAIAGLVAMAMTGDPINQAIKDNSERLGLKTDEDRSKAQAVAKMVAEVLKKNPAAARAEQQSEPVKAEVPKAEPAKAEAKAEPAKK